MYNVPVCHTAPHLHFIAQPSLQTELQQCIWYVYYVNNAAKHLTLTSLRNLVCRQSCNSAYATYLYVKHVKTEAHHLHIIAHFSMGWQHLLLVKVNLWRICNSMYPYATRHLTFTSLRTSAPDAATVRMVGIVM
jgi:hypothetical protein